MANNENRNVPADHGLPGLGLSMQLGGGLFTAVVGMVMVSMLMAGAGRRGEGMLFLFIIGAASVVRSFVHSIAGSHLLYQENPFAKIPTYAAVAAGQTFLTCAILVGKMRMPGGTAIGLGVALMIWPVVLLVISRLPRYQQIATGKLPNTEDKGFEGLSALMVILGTAGVAVGGLSLYTMLKLPGRALQEGTMMLFLLGVGMLFVRSILHVRAAISGLNSTDHGNSTEKINQYANFGVIAGLSFGAVLFILFTKLSRGASGSLMPMMCVVAGMSWMLLVWPLAVKRYVADRTFNDLLGEGAGPHRRASDGGATFLGWFLVANGLMGISMAILGYSAKGAVPGMFGGDLLLGLVGSSLMVAAGRELVIMSNIRKLVALTYGVVGIGLSLYNVHKAWEQIRGDRMMRDLFSGDPAIMVLGQLVLAIAIPVTTIVIATRKLAPTATARYRDDAGTPPAAP